MSKEMDDDFAQRIRKAATHKGVAFTPQSVGTFLDVDRRKAAVWMAGSLPRPDKLFEHADRFGVDPRWYATGKGDMLPGTTTSSVHEPRATYDAGIKGALSDAEKLLVLIRTFLDTDAAGRKEMLIAANAVKTGDRDAGRQSQPKRARRR